MSSSKFTMGMNGRAIDTGKSLQSPTMSLFGSKGKGAGTFSRSVQRMKMTNTRSSSSISQNLSNPKLEAQPQGGGRKSKLGMSLLNVIQEKLKRNEGQNKNKEDAQKSGIFTVTDPLRIRQLKDGQEKAKELNLMINKSFDGYIVRKEAQFTLRPRRKANLVLQRQNAFCIDPIDEINAAKEREAKEAKAQGKKTQKNGFFAYTRKKTATENKIITKNSLCDSEDRVSVPKISPGNAPAETKQSGRKSSTVSGKSKRNSVSPNSILPSFMRIPSLSEILDKPMQDIISRINISKASIPMKI
jgi:hypothetical protein